MFEDQAPERKEQYIELQGEARELAAAMECMEMQLRQIAEHAAPLEQVGFDLYFLWFMTGCLVVFF
jgi:hypothetical protein